MFARHKPYPRCVLKEAWTHLSVHTEGIWRVANSAGTIPHPKATSDALTLSAHCGIIPHMTTFTRPTEQYTVSCPNRCSGKVVKIGFQAGKQRYRCRACNKDFREPDAFQQGRRFPIQQVGTALQAYFDGLSYRETARNIGRTFNTKTPDEASVFRWIQGYTRGANEVLKNHKVPTGREWVADELQVNVGGKPYWLWNVQDRNSRYLLSTHLTPKRDARAAEIVMRKAQSVAANTPKVIRTDKLPSYIPAIKKVFDGKTKHLQSQGLAAEINNNLSERMQGSIRERDKVLRAMKSREAGQNYLDGWAIDYNLFRPHLGLRDRTPAQAAGMVVPFTSWQDVAQKVTPILQPVREGWQTQDEHILADKGFQVMDVAQAQEASIKKKRSDTGFKVSGRRF